MEISNGSGNNLHQKQLLGNEDKEEGSEGYPIVQNKKNDQIVGEITKYDYHQMKCKK